MFREEDVEDVEELWGVWWGGCRRGVKHLTADRPTLALQGRARARDGVGRSWAVRWGETLRFCCN